MILCISHSSRSFGSERTSLNFLTRRYSDPDRLLDLPEFTSLLSSPPARYQGKATVWRLDDPGKPPLHLSTAEADYRIQHAVLDGDSLVLCGLESLERVPLDGSEPTMWSDVWFQDGHTAFPMTDGRWIVSCSASDAVLIIGSDLDRAEQRLRVPESLYGNNYPLSDSHDLRQHVIRNDHQLTHLNCAWPCEQGILVSGLIPGMIGLFERDGSYREIVRGYVGLHGVRTRPGLDGFYFADSALGCLVEMDWTGSVRRRFQVQSRWLHDVQHVHDNIYLFSVSDSNTVQCWDVGRGEQLWSLPCSAFGNTTQFLSLTGEGNDV